MAPMCRVIGTTDRVHLARILRQGAAVATLFAACVIAGAPPVTAQARAGGHVFYQSELVDGSFGYGGRVEFDLGFLVDQLVIGGTYDRVFPECDDCTSWEAGGQVGFYSGQGHIGLGAYFSRFETAGSGDGPGVSDDWTFALVGGVRFPLKGFLMPFLEIRQELGQGFLNSQTIALGILLGPYGGGENPRTPARGAR